MRMTLERSNSAETFSPLRWRCWITSALLGGYGVGGGVIDFKILLVFGIFFLGKEGGLAVVFGLLFSALMGTHQGDYCWCI